MKRRVLFLCTTLLLSLSSQATVLDFTWTAKITYVDNLSGADLILDVDDVVSWTMTIDDDIDHILVRGSWTGQLLTAASSTEIFSATSLFASPLSEEPADRTLVSESGIGTMQFWWPTGGGARIDTAYTNSANSTGLDSHFTYADGGFNSVEYHKLGDWVYFMDVQDVTITAVPEPSSIALVLIGASALLLRRNKRANQALEK